MEVLKEQISANLFDTLSGLNQDRVRLKKRRLESHFKSLENITGASFTIASEQYGDSVIGVYFLRLNAKPPIKSMQSAAEGYCSDRVHSHPLSPVFFALYKFFCWGLEDIPVTFHFTSQVAMERCQALLSGEDSPKDLIESAVCLLCKTLPKVEILPCMKGPFFEKMQSKVFLTKSNQVNEVVSLDFEVIAKSLFNSESYN
jgi:hypothetical protein